MSDNLKNSTFGTKRYGPFKDGTVQTYFKYSVIHPSKEGEMHRDFELVTPAIPRDKVRTIDHMPVKTSS